jgi:hypothetical protein
VRYTARTTDRLRRYRAVATKFDKLAIQYEATIQVTILLDRSDSEFSNAT